MRIEQSTLITHPLSEVVAWHERPGALVRMCPPGLGSVDDPTAGGLNAGRRVATHIGIPLAPDAIRPAWVLRHETVERHDDRLRFEDRQERGPFRSWRHTHDLVADGGGTRLDERIDLELPGPGAIGERLAAASTRGMLRFRAEQVQADLDLHARFADRPRLRVAIAGASGLIGTQLAALLRTGGHTVLPMVRGRTAGPGEIAWDPRRGELDPADLEGIDAVVDLAGRSIATRMTTRAKNDILSSRVSSGELIARTLAGMTDGPRVLVQASAIGIYGAQRPGELLTEGAAPGDDFLTQVCTAWEGTLGRAAEAGIRTVALRTGIVLSDGGGALLPQLPMFLAGVGGRLTDKNATISWITLDDMVRSYAHALLTDGLTGPVNAVAPSPVNHAEFARTLGRVLHRPSFVPVPAFGPRAILGREGARALVETDQNVDDTRLRRSGFAADTPNLEQALRHVLRR